MLCYITNSNLKNRLLTEMAQLYIQIKMINLWKTNKKLMMNTLATTFVAILKYKM